MPPVSQAQRRFFRWAAEHPKQSGVAKSVSTEFNDADKGGVLPEHVKDGKPETSKERRRRFYANPRAKEPR